MSYKKKFDLVFHWVVFALIMFGLIILLFLELSIVKAVEPTPEPNVVWYGDEVMYEFTINTNQWLADTTWQDITTQFQLTEQHYLGMVMIADYVVSGSGTCQLKTTLTNRTSLFQDFLVIPGSYLLAQDFVAKGTTTDTINIYQYINDLNDDFPGIRSGGSYVNINSLSGISARLRAMSNTGSSVWVNCMAYLRIIPVYYGVDPDPEQEPIYNCWPGASELTSVEGLDPFWVAMCAECIPHLVDNEQEQGYYGIPTAFIPTGEISVGTDTPEKELTKQALPTSAITPIPYNLPAICESEPGIRDETPIVDDWLDIVITESATCYTILPQISITIPSFLTLWEEFTVSVTGFELCVYWVLMPELRFLDWTLPLGALVIGVVFMFIRRVE